MNIERNVTDSWFVLPDLPTEARDGFQQTWPYSGLPSGS